MNPLYAAGAEAQEFCTKRGWSFCMVGGICVMRWGGHRETKDIDLLIDTPFGGEMEIIDGLYDNFPARFPDVRERSPLNRVVQIDASNGIGIDIALGRSRRMTRIIARATYWHVEGAQLLTCSPEDTIVNKALAGREKDWTDIERIVANLGPALDAPLVMREFAPVLRQGHHLTDPLAQLQRDNHHEAIERLESILGL